MYYHNIVIATDLPANFALLEISRITKMRRLAEMIFFDMVNEVGRLMP